MSYPPLRPVSATPLSKITIGALHQSRNGGGGSVGISDNRFNILDNSCFRFEKSWKPQTDPIGRMFIVGDGLRYFLDAGLQP
jgi:hypothetical protein